MKDWSKPELKELKVTVTEASSNYVSAPPGWAKIEVKQFSV